jgi:hypothetical protein
MYFSNTWYTSSSSSGLSPQAAVRSSTVPLYIFTKWESSKSPKAGLAASPHLRTKTRGRRREGGGAGRGKERERRGKGGGKEGERRVLTHLRLDVDTRVTPVIQIDV